MVHYNFSLSINCSKPSFTLSSVNVSVFRTIGLESPIDGVIWNLHSFLKDGEEDTEHHITLDNLYRGNYFFEMSNRSDVPVAESSEGDDGVVKVIKNSTIKQVAIL